MRKIGSVFLAIVLCQSGGLAQTAQAAPDATVRLQLDSKSGGAWLSPYMQNLAAQIQRTWQSTASRLNHGSKPAETRIGFAILRDGSIQEAAIVSSSGDAVLDKLALDALNSSSPAPDLPTVPSNVLKVTAIFDYGSPSPPLYEQKSDALHPTYSAAAPRSAGPQDKRRFGPIEVLSDTEGVDFAPYLNQVVATVKKNWYLLIPDEARPPELKKGKVVIEFAILRDGSVADMLLRAPSGDVAFDRAAWGAIAGSAPLLPLPTTFTGPELKLRFRFYYNPAKSDLSSDTTNQQGDVAKPMSK